MSIDDVARLVNQAGQAATRVQQVTALIQAGEQLVTVIRSNIELAAETASEEDLAVLRTRAAELGLKNQALSEQVDALLSGRD